MNWIWGIMLAFLIACSQAPEPTVAPTSYVVFSGCEATQSIGEKCTQNCDCLKPADCIKGTCSLTKQKDGELCVDNKQCISGYCTETGRCGGPDAETAIYKCKRECRPHDDEDCYTVCR